MTFFNPWAFGLAGLVPVIVALYLLKVQRRPVTVSTLMFWQRVLSENQRRALFQRLRQWLSLLLHLLIFALVLLALTRPTLDRTVHEGSSTVLVIDNRARMQAVEPDGETRLEKAERAAESYARQAAPGRQMALASTEPNAGVRLGFTGDEKALRESIASLTASDAGGTLQESLGLAGDLLASRAGEKRILFFTDRAEPTATATGATIETITVGTARDNIAITRFASRALPASPETYEVLLEVANFSARAWAGNVEVTLDTRLLDVHPFQLASAERKAMTFTTLAKAPARGAAPQGQFIARLQGHDALPLDDVAYAVLPLEPPRRVLLVTKGNWFLEKLLAADLRLRYELLAPGDYQPAMAAQFDVVVLDDVATDARTMPASGNFLYLRQSPFGTNSPPLERPLITDADSQHPILRLTNLEQVTLARAAALEVPPTNDGWRYETLLRFGTQPLLITGQRPAARGEQRLAALAFSTLDSDLPLRVAFPLMVANTLQWLAGATATEAPLVKAGDTLPGTLVPTLATGGRLTNSSAIPANVNGFYEWKREAGAPVALAVNTFDPAEADLRQAPSSAPLASGPAVSLTRPVRWSIGGWPWWQYLALAGALLCAAEWWLFHRRQTE